MFRASFKVVTVWGIPIKIHVSLIVLLALVAFSGLLSLSLMRFLVIVGLEIGLFTSIALHELGHSFVAIRKGCRVREITLLFIGGAAQMEDIPSRPRDEFQMAIAGPLVSIALGGVCWGLGTLMVFLRPIPWSFPFWSGGAVNIVQFLGLMNFVLAGFNLLPSFPMDGGRVLRALLTRKYGRLRATFIASRLGQVTAIVLGLFGFLSTPKQWFLVAIAFFIYIAAGNEFRMVQIQEAAKGRGFWTGVGADWTDEDDQVSISPPPYEKGPRLRTHIHTERENPLKRFFRR